jgi:hypothetical protein
MDATAAAPQRRAASAALVHELRHVLALNEARASNPFLAGALDRLREWQAARLRHTYADLAANRRYAGAVSFFQSDLYGGGDFSRRDADLMRVVPTLVRFMAESVVLCMAQAVELNALSQELDRLVLARLPRVDGGFSVADYCRAYRRAGEPAARRRQIELIGEVGTGLDRYVHKRLARTSLTLMRRPARLAGLASLQDFLERGFAAFHAMHGASEFLATVQQRESALTEAIMAGDIAPFSDPTIALATPRADAPAR